MVVSVSQSCLESPFRYCIFTRACLKSILERKSDHSVVRGVGLVFCYGPRLPATVLATVSVTQPRQNEKPPCGAVLPSSFSQSTSEMPPRIRKQASTAAPPLAVLSPKTTASPPSSPARKHKKNAPGKLGFGCSTSHSESELGLQIKSSHSVLP